MAVLALDLASKAGWAVYAPGMDRPFFGSLQLRYPGEANGVAAERLRAFMADQQRVYNGFTDIVFEDQHISNKINPQTAYMLIGLGFMAEWFAHRVEARCFPVAISTWRLHFLGRGSFTQKKIEGKKVGPTGRQQAKQRVMDVCAEYGWYPPDDNAADACGILDYYLSIPAIAAIYPRPWRDARIMRGARLL